VTSRFPDGQDLAQHGLEVLAIEGVGVPAAQRVLDLVGENRQVAGLGAQFVHLAGGQFLPRGVAVGGQQGFEKTLPPGLPYVDYMMPGIFVQVTVFGAMNTAIGLAADLQTGLLERFRSLPMSRVAVLAGRTLADLARNVLVVALMTGLGFAVGFRIHNGAGPFLAGLVLVLAFGLAMSWVYAVIGLAVGDPETAQAAGFPVLAPLVFASSAFIPVATMPGWLQAFAAHQPVSYSASAVRALVLGGPTATYVWDSLAWYAAIILVFAPLGARLYRRTA